MPRVRGWAFNRRVANCGSRALGTTYVWGEGGAKGRESTDWVAATEAKSETKYFVQVDWVGIEDANVHLPFFEIVCWDKTDAWREILMDLGASFVFLSWWAVRDLGLFVRLFPYFWELLSCGKVLKLALKRIFFCFFGSVSSWDLKAHLAQALCHEHCDWNSLSWSYLILLVRCWLRDVAFLQQRQTENGVVDLGRHGPDIWLIRYG